MTFRLTNKERSASPDVTYPNGGSKDQGANGRMDLAQPPNDTFKFHPLANGVPRKKQPFNHRPTAGRPAVGGGRLPKTVKYARQASSTQQTGTKPAAPQTKELDVVAELQDDESLPSRKEKPSETRRDSDLRRNRKPQRARREVELGLPPTDEQRLEDLPEFDDYQAPEEREALQTWVKPWVKPSIPPPAPVAVESRLAEREGNDIRPGPASRDRDEGAVASGRRDEAALAIDDGGEEALWPEDEEETDHVPTILVLDRQGSFASNLAKATATLDPAPEILRLSRTTEVLDVVAQDQPDVLVAAPREVTGAGLRRLAEVHHRYPKVVIILSDNGKPISPLQTAACGTHDILPATPTKARLRNRISRALETAEELRQERLVVTEKVVIEAPPPPPPEPDPEPAPAPVSIPRPKQLRHTGVARVFTVASASGGCGKTFFSTNLAAYLATATRSRVLLVDLDLQFGEVAIALHLRPQRTIAELIQEEDIAAALPDFVVGHRSGFNVLCAPKDPVAGDRVGPRETSAILEAARTQYDFIVVDTPPTINETVLATFDQSQSLVIMATMDLPSLKNLRIFLQTLEKLSLPADQVSVVINKAEAGTGIDLKEVEPLYPQGFSAVLPYSRQVSWSLNMGAPILESDPHAEISRKLADAARRLVPPNPGVILPWAPSESQPRRRGWFMRLLKGSAA
ncbi:MAG: AAA family ATPase [Actinomycetota bacterium]|nr:AAA family ATPase [Actinomycetota bacterium]